MRAHLHLLKPGSDRFGWEHDEPLGDRDGWYGHAATLEVDPGETVEDTLQAVWWRTQHKAADWTGGEGVVWVSGPGLRSSHVGDVIVLEGASGRAAYEVAFAGFRRIDVAPEHIPPARTVPPTPAEWEAEQAALGDRALGDRHQQEGDG